MNRPFYVVTFQQSLERVLRKQGFLDDFYDHFIRQSPEVAGFFKHKDMEALKHKLDTTLHTLIEVAEGRPGTQLYTEMLGRIHRRLGVGEHHLDQWMDALLETVARYDDAYDSQVAEAWSRVIEMIISRMYPQRQSSAKVVG
ncbi:MAG: globin domain-containing protein [Candidatus Thiodiazotropha sp.]